MRIETGSHWRHHKGGAYTVIAIARLESSDTFSGYEGNLLVVYQQYGNPNGMTFARPIDEWCEEPPGEQPKQRMRFVPVTM